MKQPAFPSTRNRCQLEENFRAHRSCSAPRRQQLAALLLGAITFTLTPLASAQDEGRGVDSGVPIPIRLAEFPSEAFVAEPPVAADAAGCCCESHCGSCDGFCDWWKELGTLYSNPENACIQELKFIGRFHYQYGLVDGKGGGNDVDYETDELRRFRAGFTSKFHNYWDLYAEAEISDDDRPRGGGLAIRFQQMWQFRRTSTPKRRTTSMGSTAKFPLSVTATCSR